MTYEEGDRVELIDTTDEYTNLEEGDRGTVTGVSSIPGNVTPSGRPETQVWIDWDNGGSLALIQGEDRFRRIEDG